MSCAQTRAYVGRLTTFAKIRCALGWWGGRRTTPGYGAATCQFSESDHGCVVTGLRPVFAGQSPATTRAVIFENLRRRILLLFLGRLSGYSWAGSLRRLGRIAFLEFDCPAAPAIRDRAESGSAFRIPV